MSGRRTFEDLVRNHHAAVYRTARRIVGHEQDALDVTQQVFVRVLEDRARFARADDPGRVLRYLASRVALTHLRTARNRSQRERRSAVNELQPTLADGPMEERERRAALFDLIDRLPDDLRAAIGLRFASGLSYDEMSDLLECSKPTAYDRVRRGLERLRAGLARAGHAVVLADVEDELGATDALRVPPALKTNLLGLATATKIALPSAASALILVSALGAVLVLQSRDAASRGAAEPSEARLTTALGDSSRAAGDPPPRPVPLRAATDAASDSSRTAEEDDRDATTNALEGSIRGVVRDDLGRPFQGLVVEARSAVHVGKVPRSTGTTTTAADGRFDCAAPASADGETFELRLRYQDGHVHTVPSIFVLPGVPAGELALQVDTHVTEVLGDYHLELLVVDELGRPIPDVTVAVHRVPLHGRSFALFEASGATDANGRTRVRGTWLGEKRVDLRAIGRGRATRHERVAVHAGTQESTITLERRREIAGVVLRLDDGPPVDLAVTASPDDGAIVDPTDAFLHAHVEPDGSFRFHDLAAGDYTLRVRAQDAAGVTLSGVAAGSTDLRVTLKPFDDASAGGTHRAEIHGRAYHATTGAPFVVAWPELETLEVPAAMTREQLWNDFLPSSLFPHSRQIASFGDEPPPTAEFHRSDLAPGTYVVRYQAPNFGTAFAGPFELGPAEIVRDVVLRVPPAATIEGILTDAAGAPVADARVFVGGIGEHSDRLVRGYDAEVRKTRGAGFLYFRNATSDADGCFRIDGLPADLPLRVVALHPAYLPVRTGAIALSPGETTRGVRVRFDRSR